ncbi:MAG TPA: tetratricopeptide repeat protein, partial [Sulfuriferula sp.]|nr:tetratricopeptide repeat protein [Sulfuriferula sp.]
TGAMPQPAATPMPVLEQQAVLPPQAAAKLDPGKQEPIPANAAPPRSSADSGKPNPAAPTQQLVLPDGQAGSGEREVPGSMAVTKQVKEITPQQRAENEYSKAVALLQQGRAAEANELLAHVLQLDPGNTAARQTLVGLLVEGKRYDEAERRLQDGLKLDPSQARLAMILARLQVEQGDTQSGLKTLQHSLPYAAERPDYQAFLAALLQREGRHKEAIEHYLQALRKVPGSGVWLMGLGISLQAENRQAEAQEAFIRAKASNTLSPDLQAYVEQQLKQFRQQ